MGEGSDTICPRCGAPNPLGSDLKCVKCRKRLPAHCFGCGTPIGKNATACSQCGRGHWVIGDFADLPCASENGTTRQHRYMTTVLKARKVMHEWRCMKCLTDETRTDALAHFPDRTAAVPTG